MKGYQIFQKNFIRFKSELEHLGVHNHKFNPITPHAAVKFETNHLLPEKVETELFSTPHKNKKGVVIL